MTDVAVAMARNFLSRALGRAQTAQAKGKSPQVRLALSKTQCPWFFTSHSLDAAEAFRSELALAERAGAIAVIPVRRAQPPRDVAAIRVDRVEALAERLGVTLRVSQLSAIQQRLSPFLTEYPVLTDVLDRWRDGKTVRKQDASDLAVKAILDAIVVRAARSGQIGDVLLRRESQRLFGDTKRIEAIAPWLDVLHDGQLAYTGLAKADLFASMGLRKEPQPLLIAGDVWASDGRREIPLFRPYHGLPMEHVAHLRFDVAPSSLVTVENKASFHELALLAAQANACVVYTGGMPSPAWKQVYQRVLAALTADTPVYHFGDVDVGGFRIAEAVATVAREHGITLQPWLMDPATLVADGHLLAEAKASACARMVASCEAIGWGEVAESIRHHPGLIEQEAIRPRLP